MEVPWNSFWMVNTFFQQEKRMESNLSERNSFYTLSNGCWSSGSREKNANICRNLYNYMQNYMWIYI